MLGNITPSGTEGGLCPLVRQTCDIFPTYKKLYEFNMSKKRKKNKDEEWAEE